MNESEEYSKVRETPEFQRTYIKVKRHIRTVVFCGLKTEEMIPPLLRAISFYRGDRSVSRYEQFMATGKIEREYDTSYCSSSLGEEMHYHDYIFMRCCSELTILHLLGRVDVFSFGAMETGNEMTPYFKSEGAECYRYSGAEECMEI